MTSRVTQDEVRVNTQSSSINTTDVSMAIKTANVVVEEYLVGKGMSEALLTQIELFLASHFLVLSVEKGPLQMDKIGEATERYHKIYAAGLNATRFGQQAVLLDRSNTLGALTSNAIKPMLPALFTTVGSQPPGVPDGQYGWNDPATLGSDWYP